MTASTMLPLGTLAPAFSLPDVTTGRATTLATFTGAPALLVMFICRHCPYVKHVQSELALLGRNYGKRGVAIVGISANDAETHPEDSPENLNAMVVEQDFTFPVCHDKTQSTAQAYAAACTPDFFLFDDARKLVYRGQLDPSRPGGEDPTGIDLRAALDAVLEGRPVSPDQTPSLGCNIKWKPGNEPAYFAS
jgi:peroxiredoxin